MKHKGTLLLIVVLVALSSFFYIYEIKGAAKRKQAEEEIIELKDFNEGIVQNITCLLYTSPSPRDRQKSRMPSSA